MIYSARMGIDFNTFVGTYIRTFLMTPSKCSIYFHIMITPSSSTLRTQKNPTPQRLGLGLIHKPRPEPVRRQWHFAIPLCGPMGARRGILISPPRSHEELWIVQPCSSHNFSL